MLKLTIKTKQDAIDALRTINSWLESSIETKKEDAETVAKVSPDIDKFAFVDLGLPSGKLWASENVRDENGKEAYFSFDEAVENFNDNLPSKDDWKELIENCTYKWLPKSKAPGRTCAGYLLTGPNGNNVFLPAAGYRFGTSVYYAGSYGYYWSSSPYTSNVLYAYGVSFSAGNLYPQDDNYRYYGRAVRLVR